MFFLAIRDSYHIIELIILEKKWGIYMKREDLRKNILPVTLYNTNFVNLGCILLNLV